MTVDQSGFTTPNSNEYAEYYRRYIDLFEPVDFVAAFQQQTAQLESLLGDVSAEESNKLHAPYTWSLKQVVGHLIDCERIFSYRALRIAVGDTTPIPGIDQNRYVDQLDYSSVSMSEILTEFRYLRSANVELAKRMNHEKRKNCESIALTFGKAPRTLQRLLEIWNAWGRRLTILSVPGPISILSQVTSPTTTISCSSD